MIGARVIKANIFSTDLKYQSIQNIIRYLIDKVDKEQEGIQFNWQDRVLITVEPSDGNPFKNGYRLDYELDEKLARYLKINGLVKGDKKCPICGTIQGETHSCYDYVGANCDN